MVHKSKLIPGLSQFIDNNILSHYPPTSMKRIVCAGGMAIYLNNGEKLVDSLLNSSAIAMLGVVTPDGMVNVELLRDVYKKEIQKAGYMRVSLPIIGDVDFTADDVASLYSYIVGNKPSQLMVPQTTPTEVF